MKVKTTENIGGLLINDHKILIVDDCLNECNTLSSPQINFLNPYGRNKTQLISEIVSDKSNFLPLIGANIKYSNETKRTSYEGIKLLLEISEYYLNSQSFSLNENLIQKSRSQSDKNLAEGLLTNLSIQQINIDHSIKHTNSTRNSGR